MLQNALKPISLYIIALFLFTACRDRFAVQGFDTATFKQDAKGCKGQRLAMLHKIDSLKTMLIGKDDASFTDVFGTPDRTDLLQRNQKTHFWFLESGKQCGTGTEEGRALKVKFSAVNVATEIVYTKY